MQIERPTPAELRAINAIGMECASRGWLGEWKDFAPARGLFAPRRWDYVIDAPLKDLGPVVARIMRPGPASLTAILLADGTYRTASEGPAELREVLGSVYREPDGPSHADVGRVPGESLPDPPAAAIAEVIDLDERRKESGNTGMTKHEAAEPPAKAASGIKAGLGAVARAAVTIARPTCCCPQCYEGNTGEAEDASTEVLLSFLTPEQHEDWKRRRAFVAIGELSGNRYLVAHRRSRTAARIGRSCYDLDDRCVVHCHDNGVPPAEECLAIKLCLEHREPWLANEATKLGASGRSGTWVFKNPFGGGGDGTEVSALMHDIGTMFGVRG
jgi:hypothetical protein